MQTISNDGNHLRAQYRPGKTLNQLAQELTRIEESKRDFIVPVGKLAASVITEQTKDEGSREDIALEFANGENHKFKLNNWSAGQLAGFADIPKSYFDKLRDQNPELLVKNVNHGFKHIVKDDETNSRLLRTIDGRMRGFLSHRYRMLDAHDLLEQTLPLLIENQFQVQSCEVTEQRLYLKAVTPRIEAEVKVNDAVQYGIMISTSDVGAGSLRVEPFFWRLVCLNGMVRESKFRQRHLGGSRAERDVFEILTDDTKRLDDAAFYAKVRDWMAHTMKPEVFKNEMQKMIGASQREIKNYDLEKVVEVTMSTVGVTGEKTKNGILAALAHGNQGAGLTQWGLLNSFTSAAKMEHLDYDQATEMERAAGQILELTPKQWHRIAEVEH